MRKTLALLLIGGGLAVSVSAAFANEGGFSNNNGAPYPEPAQTVSGVSFRTAVIPTSDTDVAMNTYAPRVIEHEQDKF